MTLKLKPAPTFWSKIDLPLPGGATAPIEIEFKHMDKVTFERWRDERKPLGDADAFCAIVVGWKGIDGEFNNDNITEFLNNYHGAGRVIGQRFFEDLLQVKLGN